MGCEEQSCSFGWNSKNMVQLYQVVPCWMFGYIYRETSGSKLAKSSNTFHFYWPSGFLSLDSAFFVVWSSAVCCWTLSWSITPNSCNWKSAIPSDWMCNRRCNVFNGRDPGLQPKKKSNAVEIPFPFLTPWKSPTNLPIGYPKFRPTAPPTRRQLAGGRYISSVWKACPPSWGCSSRLP